MALNFPNTPTIDDTYSFGGKTWKWNGEAWEVVVSAQGDAWGSITGTLSDQTDLQGALDGKSVINHNHDGIYVKPTDLGSAASAATTDFASAAQGANADAALPKAGGTMTGVISFAGTQTWPSFNQDTTGSAAKLTTARTLTIGGKGYAFDGSGNVTWTLVDIGAAAAVHSHSDATTGAAGFMSAADKTKLDGITGGSIAPGTIQYFTSDPGAGWLKCDRATYLRSSYPDLSAKMPINLLNCPPSFGGAQYAGTGGNITDIAPVPGTNYLLLHCSGWSGKQLELLEYDPSTQSVSRVGASAAAAAANVGGMSIARDGSTTYVACATHQNANRLDLFKIVGTTITKLTAPATLPTNKVEAVAFFNGGANLAVGLSAGEPTSDVRIWTYSRSGDTFTKDAEIGSLPASPVSFRSMSVSPSGKTLWVTLDRDTRKNGHLFDVSGSTLTNLTESGADPINVEFNAAFAPRTDIDLWFSGSSTLFAQYRLGATNAVLGTNGRVDNSSGQAAHVGAMGAIVLSPDGSMLVTSSTTAPWHSVFRVSADYVLTPMFACPDVSLAYTGARVMVFTPDSRCIVLKSTTNDTLQMIRSDTTKLIVPDIPNGWIKT